MSLLYKPLRGEEKQTYIPVKSLSTFKKNFTLCILFIHQPLRVVGGKKHICPNETGTNFMLMKNKPPNSHYGHKVQ